MFITSLVFAMYARQENYFPRPWMNYLSWSFGCNVVSGFLSSFGGICLFIMAMILKEKLFMPDNNKALDRELRSGGSGSVITGTAMMPPSEKAASSKAESFV